MAGFSVEQGSAGIAKFQPAVLHGIAEDIGNNIQSTRHPEIGKINIRDQVIIEIADIDTHCVLRSQGDDAILLADFFESFV